MSSKRASASPDLPLIDALSLSAPQKRPRRLPPQSTLVHRLPIDVLALIFEFFPLRPRLMVVARVCKRWNVAVVRSVSELSLYARFIALLPELLARYRSVSTLSLAEELPGEAKIPPILNLELPATLTSLSLRDLSVKFLPSTCAPVLRRLILQNVEFVTSDSYALILSSVTELELHDMDHDLPLPSLTSLTQSEQFVGDCLSKHSTQLRELRIVNPTLEEGTTEDDEAWLTHPYPCLRHLRVEGFATAAGITALLSSCTTLERLTLSTGCEELYDDIDWRRYPHLTVTPPELPMEDVLDASDEKLRRVHHFVGYHLKGGSADDAARIVTRCAPWLDTVELTHGLSERLLHQPLRFPRLDSVVLLLYGHLSYVHHMEHVRYFLRSAPRLRRIAFVGPAIDYEEHHIVEIRELMRVAQRQGVQEFNFVFPTAMPESIASLLSESVAEVVRVWMSATLVVALNV